MVTYGRTDTQCKFLERRYTIVSRTFEWRGITIYKRTGMYQKLKKIGGGVLTKAPIHCI